MKLFFLLFLCANFAPVVNSQRSTPNLASVAKKLRVTHFDCGEMTQNKLYALNQVEQCNVAPENLEVSRASVTLYTKHFRRTINATMCRVKHQSEEWHCGHNDHSSMSILHNGITSDISLSPETCKAMGEGKEVMIHGQPLKFKKGVKQVQTRNAKYGKSWD